MGGLKGKGETDVSLTANPGPVACLMLEYSMMQCHWKPAYPSLAPITTY